MEGRRRRPALPRGREVRQRHHAGLAARELRLPRLAGARAVPRAANPSQQWARPDLLGPTRQVPQRETCFGRDTDVRGGMQKPLVRQKLEPKLIFATERTFVHWLHASVVFLTFGAGAMAVADGAAGTAAERSRAWVVAVALSVGSIAINIFALYNYKWRLGRIRSREPVEWGDPRGPAVIGSILIALLSLSLVLNTRRLMAGEI